jgi:vacuole morphology and inheritance protein 14
MLLPQSSAFATLRNRLNSISPIGYLHLFPRPYFPRASSLTYSVPESTITRPDRRVLKPRVDEIKWADLLEKFRSVQLRHEITRTRQLPIPRTPHIDPAPSTPAVGQKRNVSNTAQAPPQTGRRGGRSIQTITQGIMNVGRGGEGKKTSGPLGKRA